MSPALQLLLRLLLRLLLLLCALATLSQGTRIFKNRRTALKQLSGVNEEGPLAFANCEQFTEWPFMCELAIDNDTTSTFSQCARSVSKDAIAWWKGYLENPSFVTTVVIMNANWHLVGHTDALLDFVLNVNGYTCYTHEGAESFDTKTIECDQIGNTVEIKAKTVGATLALCEVQVFGVPVELEIPTDGQPVKVSLDHCNQSSTDGYSDCFRAMDGLKSNAPNDGSCSVTAGHSAPAWLSATFSVPALVESVVLVPPSDNAYEDLQKHAQVFLGGRQCSETLPPDANASKDPKSFESAYNLRLACNHFAGEIRIRMTNNNKLAICEITVQGFLIKMAQESKKNEVGCFVDKPGDPDLSELAALTHMHVGKCEKMCRRLKKKYMGLQWGMECWCGDTHGRHGRAADVTECSMECEGKSNEKSCGGKSRNLVFELM